MSQYCYVIINNAGHSWAAIAANGEAPKEQLSAALPQLLAEGWVPVRETPMGGGSSPPAPSLILQEREAKAKPVKGSRSAK